MLVGNYLELVHYTEREAVKAFTMIADKHGDEPDVYQTCTLLASWSQKSLSMLSPFIERYPAVSETSPNRQERMTFDNTQKGSFALMRDLHDLWVLAAEIDICWTILLQAADGLRDRELKEACLKLQHDTKRQLSWLQTRIKQAAPQTLIVGI